MLRSITLLLAGFICFSLQGATVQEQVTPLGSNSFQYALELVGFSSGEALDLQFDPSIYKSLSVAQSQTGFSVVPLAPNNPPGVTGDLVIEALSGTTVSSPAGPFEIDVALSAIGQPGVLPFLIYQIDSSGTFGDVLQTGVTTLVAGSTSATPEPWTLWLAGLSLITVSLLRRYSAGR